MKAYIEVQTNMEIDGMSNGAETVDNTGFVFEMEK